MSDAKQDVRDSVIRQAQQRRATEDVKILQKVNAVNREAFVQKFPGQIEHCMRLVSERLHHCLSKPEGVDLSDPTTWPAEPRDIDQLAQALWNLEQLRQHWLTDTKTQE